MNIFFTLKSPFFGARQRMCRTISALSFEWIQEKRVHETAQTKDSCVAVFLHGLLGNRKNWRSFTRMFSQRFPGWGVLSVDLRGHGDSPRGMPPHNLEACANDLHELFQQQLNGQPPTALCGHSFGGKVALQYFNQALSKGRPVPRQTWILDTLPGLVSAEKSSVTTVLNAIKASPTTFKNKEEMVELLMQKDIAREVALWLTTNLQPADSKYALKWVFHLDIAEQLFTSYCNTSLWPLLDSNLLPQHAGISFIRAGKNKDWDEKTLLSFDNITAKQSNICLHVIPDAGHWLHIESPQNVLSLMSSSFIVN